jgi:choline monooxygenase
MSSIDDRLADFDASLPLAEALTLPGSWYTDPAIATLEQQRVFARGWQLVGRVDQVAGPGDFITAVVAGEPIMVVRGKDEVLRAFFNVCRHHAAAVLTQPSGCVDRLRCPYHGWTYALDGKLKATPEFDGVRNFDREQNGLVPVQVATWAPFVFVSLEDDPPPLASYLAPMIEQLGSRQLENMHFVERREYELACNWKVFVDNYLNGGYHVPFLHKSLNEVLEFKEYTIENFERVCLQSSPVVESQDEVTTSAVRRGRALYYWVYPNFMLNSYEGYFDTNLVVPLGIDRMKVIFDFYFTDVRDEVRELNQQSIAVGERIQDEDHAICESVQRGLSSRAYKAGRLSVRREAGENLFHRLLAGDLRRG